MNAPKKAKGNKIKLQSILFYHPNIQQQARPQPGPQLVQNYQDGNIKSFTVLILTPATPEFLIDVREDERKDLPQGIFMGRVDLDFAGRTVGVRLLYYMDDRVLGAVNNMIAYASNSDELKAAVIIFNPQQSDLLTLKSLITKYQDFGDQEHKNSLLLLCQKFSSSSHEKAYTESLNMANKFSILYMQMLESKGFAQILKRICFLKCSQYGLDEDCYKNEIKTMGESIHGLKMDIGEEERYRQSEFWELEQNWRVRVEEIYRLFRSISEEFDYVIDRMLTKSEQMEKTRQKLKIKSKISELKTIIQFFRPPAQLEHSNIQSQDQIQNYKSPSAKIRSQELENLLQQFQKQFKIIEKQEKQMGENIKKEGRKMGTIIGKLDQLVGIAKEISREVIGERQKPDDENGDEKVENICNIKRSEEEKNMETRLQTKIIFQIQQVEKLYALVQETQKIMGYKSINSADEELQQKDQKEEEMTTEIIDEEFEGDFTDPVLSLINFYLERQIELQKKEKMHLKSFVDQKPVQNGEIDPKESLSLRLKQIKQLLEQENARRIFQNTKSLDYLRYSYEIVENNFQILISNENICKSKVVSRRNAHRKTFV